MAGACGGAPDELPGMWEQSDLSGGRADADDGSRRQYRITRITLRDAMARFFCVECVYGTRIVEVVYYKSNALAKRCGERWVEHGC